MEPPVLSGMGGAMGALGGDISTIETDPAGMAGVYVAMMLCLPLAIQ